MRVNAESLEMSNIHWLVFICHDVTVLSSCVCPSVEVTAGWMLGQYIGCGAIAAMAMTSQKMLVFPIQ